MEPLEARCLCAVTWNVVFQEPSLAHAAQYDAIRASTLAAGAEWNRILPTGNGKIDVAVKFADLPTGTLARGGSATTVFFQKEGGLETRESSVAYEIRTGKDPNGTQLDAIITLDSETATQDLWFDPTPGNPFDELVPADRYDAYSIVLHELGHTLGIQGFRDMRSGQLTGSVQSRFDRFVSLSGSAPYFEGPSAKAVYGNQAVPLTPGNLYHLGRSPDELDEDLMTGWGLPAGERRSVSLLDAAIFKDLGLPAVVQPGNMPPFVSEVADVLMSEDEVREIPLIIGDTDIIPEALSVTVTSSNPGLFPERDLQYFRSPFPGHLLLQPGPNASGSAAITVTASDGFLTTVRTFEVTVTPVHDSPGVFPPPPQFMLEDQSLDVYVRLESVEVPVSSLALNVSCNLPTLFGPGGIAISGEGDVRVVHLVPAKDQYTGGGNAELQFVVSDGTSSSSAIMYLEVLNTPDLARIADIKTQYLAINESRELTFHVTDDFTSADGLRCFLESSNPELVAAQMSTLAGTRMFTLVPRADAQGFAIITLRVQNSVGESVESFNVRIADDPFPWQNPGQSMDVNGDDFISPLDALLIINLLNSGGAGELNWPSADFVPTSFYDVVPDNQVAPLDALVIIDYLNQQPVARSEMFSGEGEARGAALEVARSRLPPLDRMQVTYQLVALYWCYESFESSAHRKTAGQASSGIAGGG